MSTLTITTKGQVTFRKDVLNHLGVGPGHKLEVDKLPDGRIVITAERQPGEISDIFGILKPKRHKSLSIEDINKIASRGWARKT